MKYGNNPYRMPEEAPRARAEVSPDNIDWQAQANCRGEDPELFFTPEEKEYKAARELRIEVAMSICRRCVVRPDCKEWAIQTGQQYGIWGMQERQLKAEVVARERERNRRR